MARTTIDTWNPEFLQLSPIFDSIKEVATPFAQLKQWPTLKQFDAEFTRQNIESFNGESIHPVAQGYTPEKFDDLYESRIFLKGELQTRLENWHDFFNALCWLQFPKIKSSLNKLHYKTSQTREEGSNRSPLENAIALFDECGSIIIADNDVLLDLIRQHQWKELFYHRKANWGKHIQCYVFGHAMHEKALTPYIGMTTHSILLKKDAAFMQQAYQTQLSILDTEISASWLNRQVNTTKDLQPVPLLGIPGLFPGQDEAFYRNSNYFRPRRTGKT